MTSLYPWKREGQTLSMTSLPAVQCLLRVAEVGALGIASVIRRHYPFKLTTHLHDRIGEPVRLSMQFFLALSTLNYPQLCSKRLFTTVNFFIATENFYSLEKEIYSCILTREFHCQKMCGNLCIFDEGSRIKIYFISAHFLFHSVCSFTTHTHYITLSCNIA